MKPGQPFADLPALADHLRGELENKKAILLYAYNGTGKTRLSMAFKDIGKQGDARDTLYFNAFTEDLFHWDNDLDGDSDRRLTLNAQSRFFAGLAELEMDTRIRPLLQRYADFDFRIDTQEWAVRFSRTVDGQVIDNIKVSRGVRGGTCMTQDILCTQEDGGSVINHWLTTAVDGNQSESSTGSQGSTQWRRRHG